MKALKIKIAFLGIVWLFASPDHASAGEVPDGTEKEVPASENKAGESESEKYQPVDFGLQIKNMHLWRGYKVTQAAMTGVDVHYISRNGKFSAGIWGGAGFTGEYKEFDYYVSQQIGDFNLAIWDINNFSGRETASIFDYNPATTSHFIDVSLSYKCRMLPGLKASWSTIVAGRDFYVDESERVVNRFSNYVALNYQVWESETVKLSVFAGGAFAFGQQQHFYGEKPNLVNLGLTAEKIVDIGSYQLPVSATGMWNPEQNYGALEIAVNVF